MEDSRHVSRPAWRLRRVGVTQGAPGILAQLGAKPDFVRSVEIDSYDASATWHQTLGLCCQGDDFILYRLLGRPNGGGNQDNRGAGMSRPARCRIRLVARPSGPVSKVIWWSATLAKKFFSPSANSSNLGWPVRSPSRL